MKEGEPDKLAKRNLSNVESEIDAARAFVLAEIVAEPSRSSADERPITADRIIQLGTWLRNIGESIDVIL